MYLKFKKMLMRVRLDKNNEVTDCYSDMSDDN